MKVNKMLKFENYDYLDFKVKNVIKIKDKYGFRIILIYPNNKEVISQKSGYETIKEAQAARDLIVVQLYNKTYDVYENITVKEYLENWLNLRKNEFTFNTYDGYKGTIKNHIVPIIGNVIFKYLNRDHISNLYDKVQNKSISTAKKVRTILITAINHAISLNIVKKNIAEVIKIKTNQPNLPFRTRAINTKKP